MSRCGQRRLALCFLALCACHSNTKSLSSQNTADVQVAIDAGELLLADVAALPDTTADNGGDLVEDVATDAPARASTDLWVDVSADLSLDATEDVAQDADDAKDIESVDQISSDVTLDCAIAGDALANDAADTIVASCNKYEQAGYCFTNTAACSDSCPCVKGICGSDGHCILWTVCSCASDFDCDWPGTCITNNAVCGMCLKAKSKCLTTADCAPGDYCQMKDHICQEICCK